MKMVWLIVLLIGWPSAVYCQDFKKEKLDTKEKEECVLAKYMRSIGGGLGSKILLYKNGTFYYAEGTDMDYVYSTGNWKQKGRVIMLESSFSKKGLPLRINYIDTVDVIQDQLFHVVKNEEDKPVTDAFVQINHDTGEYFPLGDVYTSKPVSIDSVRVRFEKGFVSNWVKVAHRPYKALSIVILTSVNMRNFVLLKQWKFRKMADRLTKIK